jgi:hyperosmotically inducible protein
MKKNKIIPTGRFAGILMTLALGSFLTVACATTRPVDQQIDDSNVTADLGTKYAFDSEIDRYRIDIDTLEGIVTLRGSVADAEQRVDAERIARSTKGVRDVVNKLDVDPEPRTAKASFEDSWIAVMIDSKMTGDPEVKSRNVDVDVYEGVVTLSGIVETQTARAETEDLAKSVDGVLKVVNELQVGG